jgi:hypothetical protein
MTLYNARQLRSAAKECRRALSIQRNAYPKWVEQGKITKSEAAIRLEAMEIAANQCLKCAHLAEVSEEILDRKQ